MMKMKNRWRVVLLKEPKGNVFRAGFFPRDLHYRSDAKDLVREVKWRGGNAEIRDRSLIEEQDPR